MDKPKVASNTPAVLDLEPGTYYWCSCGLSATQPFCDGAHKGTDFTPMEVVVTQKKTSAFCRCKMTESPPYCDGAHSKL